MKHRGRAQRIEYGSRSRDERDARVVEAEARIGAPPPPSRLVANHCLVMSTIARRQSYTCTEREKEEEPRVCDNIESIERRLTESRVSLEIPYLPSCQDGRAKFARCRIERREIVSRERRRDKSAAHRVNSLEEVINTVVCMTNLCCKHSDIVLNFCCNFSLLNKIIEHIACIPSDDMYVQ